MVAQVNSRPSWDEYFMHFAEESATRSKDTNTQVGACIVKDNRVLSLGYNGAPHAFPDDEVPTCRDTTMPLEKQKYPYMVHAELNAILNYHGSLRDFNDATIYVTHSPCFECAKALAQVGIKEVVYRKEYETNNCWDVSKIILNKCNIKYRKLEK